MSVCLHDSACPGHGWAHDQAMKNAGTPRVDLSGMRKIPMPDRIELPGLTDEDRELRPSTKMLLVMAAKGQPIYQGTSTVNRVNRRAKRKAFRRARVVHRRCTK